MLITQVVTFCHGLKLQAADGKKYVADCANTEGVFRGIAVRDELTDEWKKRGVIFLEAMEALPPRPHSMNGMVFDVAKNISRMLSALLCNSLCSA